MVDITTTGFGSNHYSKFLSSCFTSCSPIGVSVKGGAGGFTETRRQRLLKTAWFLFSPQQETQSGRSSFERYIRTPGWRQRRRYTVTGIVWVRIIYNWIILKFVQCKSQETPLPVEDMNSLLIILVLCNKNKPWGHRWFDIPPMWFNESPVRSDDRSRTNIRKHIWSSPHPRK